MKGGVTNGQESTLIGEAGPGWSYETKGAKQDRMLHSFNTHTESHALSEGDIQWRKATALGLVQISFSHGMEVTLLM